MFLAPRRPMTGIGMFGGRGGPAYTMSRVRENQAQAYAAAHPAPPPAPVERPPSPLVEGLRQLAALRDRGVLTPEEFEAAKSRLLAE